jgi:predicted deacylase
MTMDDTTLSVGPLAAQPGTKVRGSVRADLGTLTVDLPLTLVNGSRPGPRVVITAGMHGGEFTPIDAVVRLTTQLEAADCARPTCRPASTTAPRRWSRSRSR